MIIIAGNIKGIVVEIGGETVGLQNALKDVNKRSKDLQSELKSVERLLKFDPGNTELLAQKQQILAEQISNTETKLQRLRDAQADVERQFQRGDIGIDQYRAFQREIVATEGQLNGLRRRLSQVGDNNSVNEVRQDMQQLSQDTEEAQGSVKELGGELAGLVGGLAAGGGIAGAIEKSLDNADLKTKIDITFDVPEESKESVRQAVKNIEAYGVDGEAALEGVRRQWALNKDASDEANQAIIDGAAAISQSYAGVDFTELIQETNEIASEMKISDENALGLVNSLLKINFPPEQLDTIAEYGGQLKRAGYDAEEIQAIMAAGVETGTWNIDNLLDGLKEGRIRVAEFGQEVPKALTDLLKGTDISAKQLQEWGKKVAKGGKEGSQAMTEIAQALNGVNDETKKNLIGVQIFGTMYEDQGQNVIDTLLNAKNQTADLKANQDQLNDAVSKLDSNPTVQLKQATAELMTSLQPVFEVIANIVSSIATWAANNPALTATIIAIGSAIAIIIGICMALTPVILTLTGAVGAFNIAMSPITLIVLAVIAAIVALIAIGVLLYKNWDTITQKAGEFKEKLQKTWENIKSGVSRKFEEIKTAISQKTQAAWSKVVEIWSNIKSAISEKAQAVWTAVKTKFENVKNAITDPIKKAVSFVKEQIEKIKGFFSGLKLKLPKIKLPHFGLKGKFSLAPPSVPKLTVDWYKNGGVFPANSPRLIGIGDANVPEAALPLSDDVLGKIAGMISKHMGNDGPGIVIQNMTVREEADIQKIARELYQLSKSNSRGKGVIML